MACLIFLKAIFYKFYVVHFWIFCPVLHTFTDDFPAHALILHSMENCILQSVCIET